MDQKLSKHKCIVAIAIFFLLINIMSLKTIPIMAIDNSTSNRTIAVCVESNYALALKSDGTVWSWGSNSAGQLGNGTTNPEYTPRKVKGLSDIIEIDTGASSSLALKDDGTVWFWGYNLDGILRDGTNSNILTPVQVQGLTNIKAISAGIDHALVLKEDGTVWTWSTDKELYQVQGLTNVVSIEAGRTSSYAITSDGQAWAWGDNSQGQLGDGTYLHREEPVKIAGLKGVKKISAYWNAFALKDDGTIWQWGRIVHPVMHQITNQLQPIQMPNMNNAVDVYASMGLSGMALTSDHHLYIVGSAVKPENENLADSAPRKVENLGQVVAGAAGYNTSMAILKDGTVWVWGENTSGLFGNGSNEYHSLTPVKSLVDSAPNPPFVTRITCDSQNTPIYNELTKYWVSFSARLDKSTINRNNIRLTDDKGNLVDSTINPSDLGFTIETKEPLTLGNKYHLEIKDIPDVEGYVMESSYHYSFAGSLRLGAFYFASDFDAGAFHSLAINDGLHAWGNNEFGQLGDGTTINRLVPVKVKGLRERASSVSAGGYHTLAILEDRTVQAWGYNKNGQLGDGTRTNRSLPVGVQGLTDIADVAAGDLHSLALKSDGTVWAWGSNADGQLGDGTVVDRDVPKQIPNLKQVVFIAAGGKHSLAVKVDGTVWAWGDNSAGQLGTGDTQDAHDPVQIKGMSGVKAVSAGWMHSFALKNDHTLWAWGNNEKGQLGNGSTEQSHVPVYVMDEIIHIDAGYDHNILATEQRNLMWGDNSLGQLGDISSEEYVTKPSVILEYGYSNIEFSAGGGHTLVEHGLDVKAWGLNISGQIGDGSTYHRTRPTTARINKDSVYYRLAGSNRIETANEISFAGWSYGTQAVVIARDDDFPDALTGTPLAYAVNGPILLTNKNYLSPKTEEEMKRLNPKVVYILGSYGAIAKGIEEKLSADYEVIRLGGMNRYETASRIAQYLDDKGLNDRGKAVVAYGRNFPDALSVSSVAAYQKLPILLTETNYIPESTKQTLRTLQISETIVVGGSGVISEQVVQDLPNTVRYSGKNRYETALSIAKNMKADRNLVFIATGTNFPDALAGSALAARTNSPVILVGQNMGKDQSQAIGEYMNTASKNQAIGLFVLGGIGVVSDDIIGHLGGYLSQ